MNSVSQPIHVRTQAPTRPIEAEAVWLGQDLLVWIWGGERPHIGAVAAAQPRASLADPGRRSATASVLAYLGHKEDAVVKMVSESLAAAFDAKVVVAAGIHWDDLPAAEIGVIMERCRELVELLKQSVRPGRRGAP